MPRPSPPPPLLPRLRPTPLASSAWPASWPPRRRARRRRRRARAAVDPPPIRVLSRQASSIGETTQCLHQHNQKTASNAPAVAIAARRAARPGRGRAAGAKVGGGLLYANARNMFRHNVPMSLKQNTQLRQKTVAARFVFTQLPRSPPPTTLHAEACAGQAARHRNSNTHLDSRLAGAESAALLNGRGAQARPTGMGRKARRDALAGGRGRELLGGRGRHRREASQVARHGVL